MMIYDLWFMIHDIDYGRGFKMGDDNDSWYLILILIEAFKYAMMMIFDSWYWLW